MPELPEIEALREALAEGLRGRRVESVALRQFALLKTFDPPLDALVGESLGGARRHGKHLLLDFSHDLALVIHLGIGGRLVPAVAGRAPPRSLSLELDFDDGSALRVVELGSKKRSSVHLLRRHEVATHLDHLGIDALAPELTAQHFAGLLAAERGQLKRFLEDQRRVAGIGNAYSDEILWEACLAPLRITTSLEAEDVARLHAAIGRRLGEAIARARKGNYLTVARGDERHVFHVHRRDGQPCPRCGERIASVYLAESSFQYCPACQVAGRRYADRRLSRLLK